MVARLRVQRFVDTTLYAAGAVPRGVAVAQECDPFGPPQFRGQVPTAQQVIGINLGDRDVTTAESDRYLGAVDAASNRVVSGTLAPNMRLRIANLRDTYGIGSTPLREALSRLVSDGFVVSLERRGFMVAPMVWPPASTKT